MGAWGTAIFSDDTALDVRGDFMDFLGDGFSASEATDRLLAEWAASLNDPDEGPVVWLGLALTQWKLGCLGETVKKTAISIIDTGVDLARWEGKDKEKRRKVLDSARQQLESPQPAPKRVPKRFRDHSEWEIGELIAYTTLSGNKVIFRVIGFHEDKGGKGPVCELLNWSGREVPGKFRLSFLGIKTSLQGESPFSQFLIGRTSEKQLPKERVQRLGISLRPSQKTGGYSVILWTTLDIILQKYFGIE